MNLFTLFSELLVAASVGAPSEKRKAIQGGREELAGLGAKVVKRFGRISRKIPLNSWIKVMVQQMPFRYG